MDSFKRFWPLTLIATFAAFPIAWMIIGVVFVEQNRAALMDSLHANYKLATFGLFVWVAFGLCVVGIALYAVRRSARLIYGAIEITAAVALIFATVVNVDQIINRSGSLFSWGNYLTFWLQLAASLYVLVRGLDNVGEGLNQYPQALRAWETTFPKDLWSRAGELMRELQARKRT